MKTIHRLIAIGVFIAGTASAAFAGPGAQHWTTMRSEAQCKELKAGDKIAYVCNQCQSVTEKTVGSTAEAMDLCKVGATVSCPSCKAKLKVVTNGSPKNRTTSQEVSYENDKGEKCFFIAKVSEK